MTLIVILTATNTLGILAIFAVVFRAGRFVGDISARLRAVEKKLGL